MRELCKDLRWKALIGVDQLDEAQLAVLYRTSDAPYGCLGTCQAWGPDGDLAAPELCQPSRACFRPSPRLRRASDRA